MQGFDDSLDTCISRNSPQTGTALLGRTLRWWKWRRYWTTRNASNGHSVLSCSIVVRSSATSSCPKMAASVRPLTERFEEITLSADQKDSLFSNAITSLRQNVHETELILENLQRWSPELARPVVKRTPDTILDTPFRLVRERTPADHRSTTSYLCISYCWLSADFKGAGLEPAAPFPFGEPFVQAVLDQRSGTEEGIWIDQLCIRQLDEVEKLRAIASMDVVYKSCRRLVIILEDAHLDDAEAAMLEKYDSKKLNFTVTWQPERSDVDALVSLCRKVTATRWWTRAW